MRIGPRNLMATARGMFPRDPRYYQILSLGLLLGYGKRCLQFDIGAAQVAVTLASVLAVQFLCSQVVTISASSGKNQSLLTSAPTILERFDRQSAFISS